MIGDVTITLTWAERCDIREALAKKDLALLRRVARRVEIAADMAAQERDTAKL